ncbi:MAG: DNA polymerase III subunit alpha [Haloferula sp.]
MSEVRYSSFPPFRIPLFCELHARSAFSFLRGASQPEALIARAAALGYPAIALCDHLGFQGSPRAHSKARQHGIRAIVGTTLESPEGTPLISTLAATRHGYAQLCQQLTTQLGNLDTSTTSPLALGTWQPREAGHLIALTGDRDAHLSQLLIHGRKSEAENFARSLIRQFGQEHLYIQLTRHHLRDDARVNRLLIDLASHLNLPLLATNSPLHATRADRLLCDAFTCLRHHTTLDQAGALLAPNGERHLKSPRVMRELFADLPEAVDHTLQLADRIEFDLENLGYRFPDAHDDHGFPLSQSEQSTRLRRLTYAGAHRRYGSISRKVRTQLEHEFRLIHKLGFPGYFLIVHEIMEFAKAHGIFCQGRGSAANSAVCYALGITNVDPVGGGLLFERFLSENRRSWPDIDIDFPSGDRRELVIQHVFERYGPRGAAMTANVITYRPRSAFREASKVLGFPPSIADRFSELSRGGSPNKGAKASDKPSSHPLTEVFIKAGIPGSHPRLPSLIHLYEAVLTMPRHLGQHSGGMIICDRGLDHIVPLQPATMPNRTIVQWDKDDCEDLGIVKVDLLGLGMLAAIEDALHICEDRGHPVDPATIPKDDPAVFDMLCRADTIGTFQVESRAQMATLPIMRPQTFYDLAIEVAIIRPGPIVGDLVHPYLNRRNGREAVDLIHPQLEPILKRTLGVPLFQEQVLRMAMTLADFTGAEADELRRAMAFKRADEKMERVSRKLAERMTQRGIPPTIQEKVIRSIGSFALYGFPESHAISFALIAYLSCWLKVHHPAEFYCGLINNQPMGFYSVNTLLEDAKRHRIRTRPISVVESRYETTVIDDHHLRLGLQRLKGVRKSTSERLIQERDRSPFTSLSDFLRRVCPNDKERRLLAASGALNPDLFSNAEHRTASEDPAQENDTSQETSDFDMGHSTVGVSLLPMTDAERLSTDLSLTGSSTGPHPMALWRAALQAVPQPQPPYLDAKHHKNPLLTPHSALGTPAKRATDLHQLRHGTPVSVTGMVICRQRPSTAKGHCFISLEDETGIANLFVPRDTFHQHKLTITTEPFLLCHGRLQISEGNQPTVYVTQLEPLPGADHTTSAPSHDFY